MHTFAHHHHGQSGEPTAQETQGRVVNYGWRYDLMVWFLDIFLFRGQLAQMRRIALDRAQLQPGEQVLDVGCGTGTLAMEAQERVGATGRAFGIDPGVQQIARARSKAAAHRLPVDFRVGVIEHLPFPDQTFDVVLSAIMMHHLPDDLKRHGLAEIARVLKPGGRLVIADFTRPEERQTHRFGAGGTGLQDLSAFVKDAGFTELKTEEMPMRRLSQFPGAGFLTARKG